MELRMLAFALLPGWPRRTIRAPSRTLSICVGVLLLCAALIPARAAARTPPPHPAPDLSAPARLFAPTSIWNQALSPNAALDRGSGAMAKALAAEAGTEERLGIGPWIETSFGSAPIYEVGPRQPTVRVQLDRGISSLWWNSLQPAFDAVPIPANARPATGSDAEMAVWQPSTNQLWEFFEMRRLGDGWHAAWGGAMQDVSDNPGYYTTGAWPGALPVWGATATSLPVAAGVITLAEIKRGPIDHALAIDLPHPRAGVWAWPAQRSDGTGSASNDIPEGAHLRLKASLNIASLGLPPLVQMIATAAQKYGMVVRDQTHHAIGFFIQDPTPTGSNPFYTANNTPSPNGPFQGLWPDQLLRTFPWAAVEVLKMHVSGPGAYSRDG
jgi:hypothetical protein